MKTMPLFGLLVLLAACGANTSEPEALKEEILHLRTQYEGARQEMFLKRDSAKRQNLSGDAAFQARLKAAETHAAALKQEVGKKKRAFRTQKQALHPKDPSPMTQ
jgi:hypothetical protein